MQTSNGERMRETAQKVDALQAQMVQLVLIQKITFGIIIGLFLSVAF